MTEFAQSNPSGDKVAKRPYIVHLSGDFPDSFEPAKTRVVESLVDLTAKRFDHEVYSINRAETGLIGVLREVISAGQIAIETRPFDHGTALTYRAPSKGLLHATKLRQLGAWLAGQIAQKAHKPDLIVGHKLTIEGIAVREAARRLGIPFAISIQGDTDTKVLAARPDLAGEFRHILGEAAMIFPFSPWAWDEVTRKLRVPNTAHTMLPCPTDLDEPLAPVPTGSGFVSVFHLKSHRRKNLSKLTQAMQILARDSSSPSLTIYGGGSASDAAQCTAIVRNVPAITLAGPRERDEVRASLNAASGFVLPSLRESFGLVFVEALFAGVPIIYPRGTAVDGYFNDAPFAVQVDARDPRSIAEGIRHVRDNERALKEELASWQQSAHAGQFQRAHIAATFSEGLGRAIISSAPR